MCSTVVIEDRLKDLVKSKNWKEIIAIGSKLPIEEKCRYLWVWPTEKNLHFIKDILNNLNLHAILSIGCGTGLLEWIIAESTGIDVSGIEYDKLWWESNYSPKSFIKLNFIAANNCVSSEFLKKSVNKENWKFALLFCYFNNSSAFQEYVKYYKGNCIIIIGPGPGRNTHTDPEPFNPKFSDNEVEEENKQNNNNYKKKWILKDFCEISSTKDFIAVYVK